MIEKEQFIKTIKVLQTGEYIDVFIGDELDEPYIIFGKIRMFGNEIIIGKTLGDGHIFICQDELYSTLDDFLGDLYDDLIYNEEIRVEQPYKMEDWN